MQFFADGICAAAYRGGPATMLMHIVSDTPFTIERIRRTAGQALCNPRLDVCGGWDPVGTATCPKCVEMYGRLLPSCAR